jgi:hypothetical protein
MATSIVLLLKHHHQTFVCAVLVISILYIRSCRGVYTLLSDAKCSYNPWVSCSALNEMEIGRMAVGLKVYPPDSDRTHHHASFVVVCYARKRPLS